MLSICLGKHVRLVKVIKDVLLSGQCSKSLVHFEEVSLFEGLDILKRNKGCGATEECDSCGLRTECVNAPSESPGEIWFVPDEEVRPRYIGSQYGRTKID